MFGPWRYGSVDFIDEHDQLRHATISDVIPSRDEGLQCVLNCGHPYPATVIPIARCLQCIHTQFTVGSRVMMLYQSSPQDPWCWHSATVLAGDPRVCAYVELDNLGKRVREVVSVARLRTFAPRTPLEKNPAFEKYWVMLPRDEDLRVVTYRKEFWPLWNRKSGTLGGWFDDEDEHQWLVYYMPAQYEPMETSDCERHLRRIKEWIDASDRELRHRMFLSTSSPSKKARSQSPEVKLEMSTELSITGIPSDILIYIFNDYLTAEDNLRSRRACKLWNNTLSSQPASSRVNIDCTDGGEIKLAKLMLKMVSLATRILFVTGNATPAPLRTLPTMLVAMNLKISVIFLKNFVVADEDILRWSASRGVRLNEAFRRVCDKVMLKDAGGLGATLKYFDCKGLKMDGSLVSGVVGVSWETDENFVQCGDPV